MFPIIPNTFVNKSATILQSSVGSSYQKRYQFESKLESSENKSVIAGSDIPRLTASRSVCVEDLVSRKPEKKKITVTLDKDNYLTSEEDSWIRMVRLSNDCHSCNILLHSSNQDSTVSIQAMRDIKKGDEISLWFSEEVLAMIAIPFLSPTNIQGEKNYICHLCGRHFEFPNPLKIHLALDCDRLGQKELWRRLKKYFENKEENKSHTNNNSKLLHGFNFQLKQKHTFRDVQKSPDISPSSPESCKLSTVSNPSPDRSDEYETEDMRSASEPPLARHSAFKPYLNNTKEEQSFKTNRFLTSLPHNIVLSSSSFLPIHNTPTISTMSTMGLHQHMTPGESFLTQQAVEMETLVSNLGRSKQGHLCIYCGKVYSRKYGLKIHIRTHTGFKPLKCKYCFRPFGDPSNLNKHVRLHAEGETPYKCEQCGKILVRRRDLERHIKSRHCNEVIFTGVFT